MCQVANPTLCSGSSSLRPPLRLSPSPAFFYPLFVLVACPSFLPSSLRLSLASPRLPFHWFTPLCQLRNNRLCRDLSRANTTTYRSRSRRGHPRTRYRGAVSCRPSFIRRGPSSRAFQVDSLGETSACDCGPSCLDRSMSVVLVVPVRVRFPGGLEEIERAPFV